MAKGLRLVDTDQAATVDRAWLADAVEELRWPRWLDDAKRELRYTG